MHFLDKLRQMSSPTTEFASHFRANSYFIFRHGCFWVRLRDGLKTSDSALEGTTLYADRGEVTSWRSNAVSSSSSSSSESGKSTSSVSASSSESNKLNSPNVLGAVDWSP